MVVFAVDISRRMMELGDTSLQCGRRIQLRQRCNPINGMARLTSRQGRFKRSEPPRLCRRPQLVRSRVYDKQDDEQILS
jgi:hypothetical protein